jgi:hypothetical protein
LFPSMTPVSICVLQLQGLFAHNASPNQGFS